MWRSSFVVPIALAAVAAAPSAAHAATLRVPQDHTTIQAAVDAASDGDTIRVARGDYAERVSVLERSDLSLLFESGARITQAGGGAALRIELCTRVRVSGAGIDGSSTDGILVFDSTNVTLERCDVVGTTGTGIHFESASSCRAERCTVFSVESYGILVDDASDLCSLIRCEVTQCDDAGIRVEADGALVDRCVVERAGAFGIEVAASTDIDGVRLLRCRVDGTGDDGIVVNGTGTLVDKCVVTDAARDGINVETESVDCVVRRCRTIRGRFGMEVQGQGGTIERNKHLGPDEVGVGVSGDDAVLQGVKITGSGDAGVYVYGGATGNVVTRVKVKSAGTFAIVLEGTGNTVSRNVSSKSAQSGLDDQSGGGNTLEKNRLR